MNAIDHPDHIQPLLVDVPAGDPLDAMLHRLNELDLMEKNINAEKDGLRKNVQDALLKMKITEAHGPDGLRVTLGTRTTREYKAAAVQAVIDMGLSRQFIAITQKKLGDLVKAGKLTEEQKATIDGHTVETEEYSLRVDREKAKSEG